MGYDPSSAKGTPYARLVLNDYVSQAGALPGARRPKYKGFKDSVYTLAQETVVKSQDEIVEILANLARSVNESR